MTDIQRYAEPDLQMLTIINSIPEGLLDLEASRLANILDGPTLIHLDGRRDDTLFVSALLHGNEPTGWEAVRRLLKEYDAGGGDKPLPRNMSLFIGNV
ncbi:MAG: peptidase M14, partial [Chromatiales bacterium]